MNNKITCKDCIHWGGRTDLNKCKLHPDIIPVWYNPKCKDYKPLKDYREGYYELP